MIKNMTNKKYKKVYMTKNNGVRKVFKFILSVFFRYYSIKI